MQGELPPAAPFRDRASFFIEALLGLVAGSVAGEWVLEQAHDHPEPFLEAFWVVWLCHRHRPEAQAALQALAEQCRETQAWDNSEAFKILPDSALVACGLVN
jgi:hypothetical protein